MKPKLLITGAGGYLGTFVVQRLLVKRIFNLHLLFDDLSSTGLSIPNVDCVLHLAAKPNSYAGDRKHIREINFDATRRLAEACDRDTPFVFLSSDYVFRSDPDRSYTEESPPDPDTDYGTSKAMAESYLLENHPNTAVVRTSMLYGYDHPRRQNFFRFLLDRLEAGTTTELFTDVFSRPTHVEDLFEFLIHLIQLRLTGIVHACGGTMIDRYHLGCLIAESRQYDSMLLEATTKPEDVKIPTHLNLQPSEVFLPFIKYTLQERVRQCQ